MRSTARLLPLDLCGGWLLPPDPGGKSRHHQIRVEDSPAAANAPCLTLVSSRCHCQICSDPCRGRAPLPDPRGFWRGMTAIVGSEWGRLSLPIRAENGLVPTTVAPRLPSGSSHCSRTGAGLPPLPPAHARRWLLPLKPATGYSPSSLPLASCPSPPLRREVHRAPAAGYFPSSPPLASRLLPPLWREVKGYSGEKVKNEREREMSLK